jgi:alpha-L-fucosidase
MKHFSVVAIFCLIFTMIGAALQESHLKETPAEKDKRLQWWREARFGMFIHWGPVSLKGTEISWSRGGERRGIEGKGEIPVEVYDNLYQQFNPVKFNAEEWVSIARSAGMKYMILTAKHCDGFCMWRSGLDQYSIASTPFKRDVCGELAGAAHKAGMRIGWYYSPMDWRDPDCRTERNEVYVNRMQGHLGELMGGNYGTIDLLWFDTDGGPAPWDQARTYGLVRSLQPGLIVNNRLDMGTMQDYNDQRISPNADYGTPEQRVGVFDDQHPWETCMTLGTQWSWKPDDTIKTSDECIRILVQCVTGDGNLLLNVGPMPNGEIEPRQVAVLKEIGTWLKKYGESVYATRGGPFRNGEWGGSTRKGSVVYLHIVKWKDGRLTLPPLDATIKKSIALSGGTVEVRQTAEGITVTMPAGKDDKRGTVVKLELDRPVDGMTPLEVRF